MLCIFTHLTSSNLKVLAGKHLLLTAEMVGDSFRVRMWVQVLCAHLLFGWVLASELTFELPDNAKQCFYEDIVIGTKCTLEFQVSDCH